MEVGKNFIKCPGCGLFLPGKNLEAHRNYYASGECFELYGELAAYTLGKSDSEFIHQLAVDTYGAQHTGPETKTISTSFALVGLYLAVECSYSGRQVQQAHTLLAGKKKEWPRLEIPVNKGYLTVLNVLEADSGLLREQMLRKWAEVVWKAWEKHHSWIRKITFELLGVKS